MTCDGYNFILHFGIFLALLPPSSPKNENFKKIKKAPGDIIKKKIMIICYSDRCHCYFSFQAIFWPFIPLTAEKNQNSKKMRKKPGDIYHFTHVYQCMYT